MPDDDASYILASWAKQFTRLLLEICRNMRKKLPRDILCKAGEIATRLQMVCPYIESLPRYWIEPDVDQLCRVMLKQLVTICLEFRLNVPSDGSEAAAETKILSGRFCTLVEDQPFARILFEFKPAGGLYQLPHSEVQDLIPAAGRGESLASILRNYRLTPRDKITLSYSVARAYWQFYDSELMRTKWNSDTIWFMPTTGAHGDHKDRLPLQAFVAFPFGVHDEPVEDFIQDLKIPLNHRCPRIFALGILLLEIGLARPFPTRTFKNLNSQVNFDHTTATNLLETLRKTKWGGFSHMRYFVDAVEYCIDGGNFLQDTHNSGPTQHGSRISKPHNKQNDLSARRKSLYNRVVRPLAWLALKGFNGDSAKMSYISRITDSTTSCAPLASAIPLKPQEGAFYSGHSASSSSWMEKLKGISAHVDSKWTEFGITNPIRVAILDTGINPGMPFYQDEDYGDDRVGQIECFRDFVEVENSSGMVDGFGHGSLMARLVADATPFESTPFAKIMVARVARNTKDLMKCQDNIAEAIRWAGDQGADVISMSFGFPRDHEGISRAIQEVTSRDGGAVLLASAGNSADEAEAFPARHPAVISIYATNRHGTFLEFNSRRPNNGTHILGTFGDGIPPAISSEFEREYRDVCQPGSSVATAVAAGMAAIMLAYIAVLPEIIPSPPSNQMLRALRRARDSRGMVAAFRAMAQEMPDGRLFVNPVQFWRVKNTDEARYHAMSSHLWDVDRGL
ncbi:hypothetical protein AK830_g7031 [Neonectria ditissima]|uniref:Uncharacterized protein n=1 Tax=Neonectria ditissima TaxID=78410 RepID=A0A0N8H6P4_9HYPO|nr:hypothetical protein AK830_g7031 [Neonectria ditissima]